VFGDADSSDYKQILRVGDFPSIPFFKDPIEKFSEFYYSSLKSSKIQKKRIVIGRHYRKPWMNLKKLFINVMQGSTP
jgi:hypothetical protein